MIGLDSVAGSPDGSSAGTEMCAVMIASTPASMAAWNGGASSCSHSSRVWLMTGRPVWLSVGGVAVAGEVLGGGGDAGGGVAARLGGGHAGDQRAGSRRRTGRR